MALEGTHIRFAIDTKKDFAVVRTDKYIAGSVYPDSRYPTGIDRSLTHDNLQMERSFWANDDFRKGWASHLLYDKIQQAVHKDWFAHILQKQNSSMTVEEDWVIRTALKILQDISDVQSFDIKSHLEALQYIETPNGEDQQTVAHYNQLFIDIYGKDAPVTIEDLEQMWIDWGVSEAIAQKVKTKACEIQTDNQLMELLGGTYAETIRRKNEFWEQYCN